MAKCGDQVVIAGDKGLLRSWDMTKRKCVKQQEASALKREFVGLLSYKEGLLAVTFDQNILFFNGQLELEKNLVGYNDEIIDIKPASDNRLVIATNSEQIRFVHQ